MLRRELAKLDVIDAQDGISDLAITFDPIFGVTRNPTQVPMEIYATPASLESLVKGIKDLGLETDLEVGRSYGCFWRYEVKLNIPENWQPKQSYHAHKEG